MKHLLGGVAHEFELDIHVLKLVDLQFLLGLWHQGRRFGHVVCLTDYFTLIVLLGNIGELDDWVHQGWLSINLLIVGLENLRLLQLLTVLIDPTGLLIAD